MFRRLFRWAFKNTDKVLNSCPYCGHFLAQRPKRKKKCIHCSNYIYVKYLPTDRIKRLVTKSQAFKIDKVWRKYYLERYPKRKKETHREKVIRHQVDILEKREHSKIFGECKIQIVGRHTRSPTGCKASNVFYTFDDTVQTTLLPCGCNCNCYYRLIIPKYKYR